MMSRCSLLLQLVVLVSILQHIISSSLEIPNTAGSRNSRKPNNANGEALSSSISTSNSSTTDSNSNRYQKRWRRSSVSPTIVATSTVTTPPPPATVHATTLSSTPAVTTDNSHSLPQQENRNIYSENNNNNNDNYSAVLTEDINTITHTTKFIAQCELPTLWGGFQMRSYTYTSKFQSLEPIAVSKGDLRGKENVLVRIHDQCFTSEVFGSRRCDCREQLEQSLKAISEEEGVVIYLQQEGRGIGIANKVAAYALQDNGMDTVDANIHLGFRDELREYYAVPDVLNDLGIKSIQLMTNNPYKIEQLTMLGVTINNRVPIEIQSNQHNFRYLATKKDRMKHVLTFDVDADSNSYSTDSSSSSSSTDSSSSSGTIDSSDTYSSITDSNIDDRFTVNRGYAFGRESVEKALAAIRNGEIVIVVDDADRENEGDLIMAAELATPEAVGFIVRHTSGVLCISLEQDRLQQLKLPPMVQNNEDPKQTAYSISADYVHGTTTGISAYDRAATFRAMANPSVPASDFHRPGHVFPLRYKSGGVLRRAGHTEASLDLSRLAGLHPAGVLAEVVNDDGSIKKLPDLRLMAQQYNLVLTSVQDIIAYRYETEHQV